MTLFVLIEKASYSHTENADLYSETFQCAVTCKLRSGFEHFSGLGECGRGDVSAEQKEVFSLCHTDSAGGTWRVV